MTQPRFAYRSRALSASSGTKQHPHPSSGGWEFIPELALRARERKSARRSRRSGFTLIEAILATVVVGLILSVLGVALIGSLRMDRAARRILAPDAREDALLAQWRDDLLSCARPVGTLTAPFTLTHANLGDRRADSLVLRTRGPLPLHPSMAARPPTAGLVEVAWTPEEGADPARGLSLVRTCQTHLLATGQAPAPERAVMLEGLAECQIQALQSGAFADAYNSDDLGAILPKLVRLQFSYLQPDGSAGPSRVLVVPLPQVDMDPTQWSGGTTP